MVSGRMPLLIVKMFMDLSSLHHPHLDDISISQRVKLQFFIDSMEVTMVLIMSTKLFIEDCSPRFALVDYTTTHHTYGSAEICLLHMQEMVTLSSLTSTVVSFGICTLALDRKTSRESRRSRNPQCRSPHLARYRVLLCVRLDNL